MEANSDLARVLRLKTDFDPFGGLVNSCGAIVAMHPDQATEVRTGCRATRLGAYRFGANRSEFCFDRVLQGCGRCSGHSGTAICSGTVLCLPTAFLRTEIAKRQGGNWLRRVSSVPSGKGCSNARCPVALRGSEHSSLHDSSRLPPREPLQGTWPSARSSLATGARE